MIYNVVFAESIQETIKIVNQKMDEGWVCLGGLGCDDVRYFQTLTNESDADKEALLARIEEILSR